MKTLIGAKGLAYALEGLEADKNFALALKNQITLYRKEIWTMAPLQVVNQPSKRNNLSTEQRKQVFVLLLSMEEDGCLKQGIYREVSERFSVERKTVSRLYNQ